MDGLGDRLRQGRVCTAVCGDRSHSTNAVAGYLGIRCLRLQSGQGFLGSCSGVARPTCASAEPFMDPKLLFWRSRAGCWGDRVSLLETSRIRIPGRIHRAVFSRLMDYSVNPVEDSAGYVHRC